MVYSEADWTIKKENDPMQYYTAPMAGLPDRIWRQANQHWFGAPGAPARYYAPFLSPDVYKRQGQCDALLLAAGQLVGHTVGILHDLHQVQELIRRCV